MTAIQLLFLTIISIIAICNGFILPKESNENLIPADLLLNSISLIGDLRGIDDLKRVERAEESARDVIAPNTLDEDYLRGMDDVKRVERSPSNSTSNKSSSSSDSNKGSTNQGNSNRNSGGSDSNSRKDGSNSDKSSSNQSSKSDSNNNEKSQDNNSKENSGDDGNGDENFIKSKLHDLLNIPNRMKEAFQRVFKLFSNGDDDGGNNNGNFDFLKIPDFLNKIKGLFGG